ncbi:MAG TPA: beta-N-acetylhexosaminidase [Chryseolinea sp.]|nr:beta-N-acetylhexosaminidase [Chryseolinea sp.]
MYQRIALVFIVLSVLVSACKQHPPTDLSKENIIPKPVSVNATTKVFALSKETTIAVKEGSDLDFVGNYLAEVLRPATGFKLTVSESAEAPSNGFYLDLVNDEELGDEGYAIEIGEDLLRVSANKPAGIFYGIQTIRQLLPADIEKDSLQNGPWEVATGTIRDFPAYPFRGSMLDVARHFFNVDDVKRYIDLMTLYKMNVLHLSLSNDQGWRIEIKSWPKLTEIGGSTEVGGGEGGFYTQEQYKELVKYAADRFVTIIPEIDMPGHTNAALASYAELNCDGKATKLYTGREVGFSTLCTTKEITYKFIDDVVREMAALTPGPYLHIGGDESHATKREHYIPFVARVRDIVKNNGKQVIGWEETAQINMNEKRPEQAVQTDATARASAASAIAQFWSSPAHALEAVGNGSKLVMSPAKKMYLDMQYDSTTKLGLHWAAYIEVDSAYMWNPTSYVKGIARENILGIEAPLWTETISNMDEIEYMVFPRIIGLAEIGWSPEENRGWDEYKVRLANHGPRMKALGIDYYRSSKVPWVD